MSLRNRKSLQTNDYEALRVMYVFDPNELDASLYYNITFRLTSTNTLYISVCSVQSKNDEMEKGAAT